MLKRLERNILRICIKFTQTSRLRLMFGFHGAKMGYYFGGEPVSRAVVEKESGKLKSGKAARRADVKGEMMR